MGYAEIVICSDTDYPHLKELSFPSPYIVSVYTPSKPPEKDHLRQAVLWIGIFEGENPNSQIEGWIQQSLKEASTKGLDRLFFIKHMEDSARSAAVNRLVALSENVITGLSDTRFRDAADLMKRLQTAFDNWREQQWLSRPASNAALLIDHADDLDLPRSFVGRENWIKQLVQDFRENKLVLLHGFAGTGKTALAGEAVSRFMDETGAHILWVSAGNAGPEQLIDAFAAPFIQHDLMAKKPLAERKELLHDALQRREQIKLLFIDDAWNAEAVQVIADLLPSQIALVVTSRYLLPSFTAYEVDSLTHSEALDLLRANTDAELLSGDHAQAADQLCSYLNDLAVVIELAGHHMRQYQVGARELLTAIQQPDVFGEAYSLDAPQRSLMLGERENAIHALLEVSITDLKRRHPHAYTILHQMGAIFVPAVSKKLLELTLPGQDVATALQTLQNLSLIRPTTVSQNNLTQYHLHRIVYDYLQRMVVDQNRENVLQGCVKYIDQYAHPSAQTLSMIEIELDNVIGALAYAARSAQSSLNDKSPGQARAGYQQQLVTRYGDFIQSITRLVLETRFFEYRGAIQKEIKLLDRAIDLTHILGNHRDYVLMLNARGAMDIQLGEYNQAKTRFETAWEQADNVREKLMIRGNQAILWKELGDYTQAKAASEDTIRLAREAHDTITLAGQLLNLGNIYHKKNAYADALRAYEEAEKLPGIPPRLLQMLRGSKANIFVETQQYERAYSEYQDVIARTVDSGDIHQQASWEANLGKICWLTGRYPEGIAPLKRSIAVMCDHGDLRAQTNAWGHLGNIYMEMGDYQQALDAHQEARKISHQLNDERNEGLDYGNIGTVYSRMEEYQAALKNFEKAQAIFRKLGLTDELAQTERNIQITKKALKSSHHRTPATSASSRRQTTAQTTSLFRQLVPEIDFTALATSLALGAALGVVGGLALRWWVGLIPADNFSLDLLLRSAVIAPFLYSIGFFVVLQSPLSRNELAVTDMIGGMFPIGIITGASAGLIGAVIGGITALLIGLWIAREATLTARILGAEEAGSAAIFKLLLMPLGGGIAGGLLGNINIFASVVLAVLVAVIGMFGGMVVQAVVGRIGLKREDDALFPNGLLALIVMILLVFL